MPGALVAGAFLLYYATRLQVHNQGGDFTNYAAAIQRNGLSDKWFYGDHLAYIFLLNWIYHSLSTVTTNLDAIKTAQAFNSIFAALGVGVFYLLGRSLFRERWISLLLAITLGLCYRYWLYATVVEVHAPAAFFYLLSLLIAFRMQPGARGWIYVALGLLIATAVLFHVIAILFVPLSLGLMLIRATSPKPMLARSTPVGFSNVFAYIGATATGVILPYWYVAVNVLHLTSWKEIYLWLLPAETAEVSATSLGSAIMLVARRIPFAFLGRRTWVQTPAIQLMPGMECLDSDLYLVRNIGPNVVLALVACSLIAGALLAVLGVISIPGFGRAIRGGSRPALVLSGWIVSFGILIGYFMPGSSEHWGIYWLPGLLLAVGLGLSDVMQQVRVRKKLVKALAAAMLLFVLIGNGSNILVQASPGNDIYVERLKWYDANTSQTDLVISGGDWMWTGYLDYYLQAQVVPLRRWIAATGYSNGLDELLAFIEKTRRSGGRIFVTPDALQRDACSEQITEREVALFAAFRESMMPRLSCFQSEETSICEVLE